MKPSSRSPKDSIASGGLSNQEDTDRDKLAVNTTHGYSRTDVYAIWVGMKYRCRIKKSKGYHLYGGRGIRVCKRWRKFENFLSDMGDRPKGMSIDRINNSGDYRPSNCRWATRRQQANNVRTNVRIKYLGITKTLTEWARELEVSSTCIKDRIKRGWSVEKTFSTPSVKRKFSFEGKKKSIMGWSKHLGMSNKTISQRLRNGWAIEKALSTEIRGKRIKRNTK